MTTAMAQTFHDAARASIDAASAERMTPIPTWAERNLMLPRGSGVTPYRLRVTPYWSHWLGVIRSRLVRGGRTQRVTICTGSQVGKTYGLLVPTAAYIVAVCPRDVGIVLPSHDAHRMFARSKLRPIFDKSARLAALLPEGQEALRKRVGSRLWMLEQSSIYFLNGAVAMDLRSKDLPIMLLDESDALPIDCDGEGDPITLAEDRQKTFPHERFLLDTSTPTSDRGLIWSGLTHGTHERLLVACQGCGAADYLNPDQLEATAKNVSADAIAAEDLAVWRCRICGHGHTTDDRDRMVQVATSTDRYAPENGGWCPGHWEANADGTHFWTPQATIDNTGRVHAIAEVDKAQHRSGHLSSLYSPFITLGAFLAHERSANTPEKKQAHCNGWRAEPWRAQTTAVDAADVDRIEVPAGTGYQHGQCPTDGKWLVLTIDQQGNAIDRCWFPYVVRLHETNGDSHLVEAGKVTGWDALDHLAGRQWPVGNRARQPELIAIDSANGNMVRAIRQWCLVQPWRRMSIQGSHSMGADTLWSEQRLSLQNQARLCGLPVVFTYNSQIFRDEVYDRMRGVEGKPRFCIPSDVPDFYRESLTSEERLVRQGMVRGRPVQRPQWVPRVWRDAQAREHVRDDNHWWDCEVMQLATLSIVAAFSHNGWVKP